jgi:hypothetical protein
MQLRLVNRVSPAKYAAMLSLPLVPSNQCEFGGTEQLAIKAVAD